MPSKIKPKSSIAESNQPKHPYNLRKTNKPAGKRIKAVTPLTAKHKKVQGATHSPRNEISLTERCLNLYNNKRLLVKMLLEYQAAPPKKQPTPVWERFYNEIHELVHAPKKKVLIASTSLVIPGKSQEFYRNIGLAIDSSKCKQREIFLQDAYSVRAINPWTHITWDPKRSCYCASAPEYPDKIPPAIDYKGEYRITHPKALKRKCQSLDELYNDSLHNPNLKNRNGDLYLNEVIIDYDRKAIVGLFVILESYVYTNLMDRYYAQVDSALLEKDAKSAQNHIHQELGVMLPVFTLIKKGKGLKRLF